MIDSLPRLSSAQLYKHLLKWDEIGTKWAGTKGELQARDYVFEEMKSYGLDTRIEEFDYLQYSNPQTKLTILEPINKELNCVPVSYYDNKEVEGELVYVGNGSREDFEQLAAAGTDFKGKIVLAVSDAPFMLTSIVQEYEAVGLLTISNTPEAGLARHCCGAFYRTTAYPTLPENPYNFIVPISGAMIALNPEANMLLSLMSVAPVKVKISHQATYTPSKSWNVIGEIKGCEHPEEKVIIGGHYDTEYDVPGVWDNGTGLAGVLEIARAIKASGIQPKRTMVFIAFSCEECGMWGSVNYTRRYKEDLKKNCVAYFNLDCTSGIPTISNALWVSERMKDFMIETAEELQWRIHIVDGVEPTFSDYAAFRDLDIPNVWTWEASPSHPYYHTEKDTIEFAVRLPELVRSTEVTELAAFKLAMSEKIL